MLIRYDRRMDALHLSACEYEMDYYVHISSNNRLLLAERSDNNTHIRHEKNQNYLNLFLILSIFALFFCRLLDSSSSSRHLLHSSWNDDDDFFAKKNYIKERHDERVRSNYSWIFPLMSTECIIQTLNCITKLFGRTQKKPTTTCNCNEVLSESLICIY